MVTLRVAALATMTAGFLAVSPLALAVSPTQEQCEAAGGTFTREQGEVTCITSTTTNVGRSENSQTVTTTDEDSSQGTLNNEPQFEETQSCSGPGSSGDSSSHC